MTEVNVPIELPSDLQGKIIPKQKQGSRDFNCQYYGLCLNYATSRRWQAWSCSQCPHASKLTAIGHSAFSKEKDLSLKSRKKLVKKSRTKKRATRSKQPINELDRIVKLKKKQQPDKVSLKDKQLVGLSHEKRSKKKSKIRSGNCTYLLLQQSGMSLKKNYSSVYEKTRGKDQDNKSY